MKPLCLPNTAPAMMQMALTGLKSGMGANRIRPAAANAPKVAVGMIWRRAGFPASNPQKNTASAAQPTSSVSNPDCSICKYAHVSKAARGASRATVSAAERNICFAGVLTGSPKRA